MLKEVNKFRIEQGLRPIISKITVCLTCRKEFESKDYPRQRLCMKCRDADEFYCYDGIQQDSILAS